MLSQYNYCYHHHHRHYNTAVAAAATAHIDRFINTEQEDCITPTDYVPIIPKSIYIRFSIHRISRVSVLFMNPLSGIYLLHGSFFAIRKNIIFCSRNWLIEKNIMDVRAVKRKHELDENDNSSSKKNREEHHHHQQQQQQQHIQAFRIVDATPTSWKRQNEMVATLNYDFSKNILLDNLNPTTSLYREIAESAVMQTNQILTKNFDVRSISVLYVQK